MSQLDEIYDDLIRDVLENGVDKDDRTGTGTRSVFGRQIRFDVDLDSFPIVTEKKIIWNSLLTELVWMVQGQTNTAYLNKHDVSIWSDWADDNGNLGPVYGHQWRNWNSDRIDQLSRTIENIRNNPDSRRHLVSAWNPSQLDEMNLVPCHFAFQFYSKPTDSGKKELSIKVSQRSCDLFIGWSFNMSSYATLLTVVAEITDHDPGEMIWSGGDIHLYQNHLDKAKKVLDLPHYEAPELEISNSLKEIDDFRRQSVRLVDYEHGPFVKAPVAV